MWEWGGGGGQNLKKKETKLAFRSSLIAMTLHGNMRIQMIQCTIGLFAILMSAFVHAFNLFVSTTRTFCLLRARNGHKRVNLLTAKISHIHLEGENSLDRVGEVLLSEWTRLMVANCIAYVDVRRILPREGMPEDNVQRVVPYHDPEEHKESKARDR